MLGLTLRRGIHSGGRKLTFPFKNPTKIRVPLGTWKMKAMASEGPSPSNTGKRTMFVEGEINLEELPKEAEEEQERHRDNAQKVRDLLDFNDDVQLEFLLGAGVVKARDLSPPYRAQLTADKWNMFLRPRFSDHLARFLKDGDDVRAAVPVNAYDKGGHEFEMMLKKWVMGREVFFVLSRGWFSFCDQQRLREDDFVAIRAFRHAITDKLCILVTYNKMR